MPEQLYNILSDQIIYCTEGNLNAPLICYDRSYWKQWSNVLDCQTLTKSPLIITICKLARKNYCKTYTACWQFVWILYQYLWRLLRGLISQPRTTDQSHMTRMEPKQKKAKSMSIGLDFAIFQIIVNLTTWFCKLSKQNQNMTSRYISDCQYLKQIFVEISEKSIFSWLGSSASKLGHCISKVAFNHLVYCHNPDQQSRDGRWKVIPVCVSVSEKPARGGESSIWLSVKEAFVYLWL